MKKMRKTTSRLPLLLLILVLTFIPLVIAGSACSDNGGGLDAKFTPSVKSGNIPLDVTFTNESEGDIQSYEWDFGDGTTSTDKSPTHTYTTAAEFTVILTVKDADGNTDSATATINSTGVIWQNMSITMSTPYAENDTTGLMAAKFKELLEEATGGNVTVTIHFNQSLVTHVEQFDALRSGAIDAAIENAGYCRNINPNFDFSGMLQGLIISAVHGNEVYADPEYRSFITNLFEVYNIHFVDYIQSYLMFGYFANFPITSIKDVNGKKIFLGRPGTMDPANQMLGASEQVYTDWSNFPTWVQEGKIDVQFTPITIAPFTGTTDVFDYCLIRPFYNANMLLFSQAKWDAMNGELQNLINDTIMPQVLTYTEGVVIQQHEYTLGLVRDELGLDHLAVQSCAEEEQVYQDLLNYQPFKDKVATMDQTVYNLIVSLRTPYTDYDPAIKTILEYCEIPFTSSS